jgi:hypothetical protein
MYIANTRGAFHKVGRSELLVSTLESRVVVTIVGHLREWGSAPAPIFLVCLPRPPDTALALFLLAFGLGFFGVSSIYVHVDLQDFICCGKCGGDVERWKVLSGGRVLLHSTALGHSESSSPRTECCT